MSTRRNPGYRRGGTSSIVTVCMSEGSGCPVPQSDLFKLSEQPVREPPPCPNCGRAMWLYSIKGTGTPGRDLLTFSCSECAQQQTAFVEREEVASAN